MGMGWVFLVLFAGIRHTLAAKVLSLDIQRVNSPISQLLRRDTGSKSFMEVIQNLGAGGGYTTNVTVGTPPQTLTLGVDTGSTNTWVLSNTADFCVNKSLQTRERTCAGGTFNADKSSTMEMLIPGGFNAVYADKSGASGDYITDVLSLGGITVKGMQIGLAFNSSSPRGTLGLAYGM